MILNYIKYEVRTDTFEVSWIEVETDAEGMPVRETQVRCQNYPREQAAQLCADAPQAEPHARAEGWL